MAIIECGDEAHPEGTTAGVTPLKAKRLAMVDDVAKGRTSRVSPIKHNRPVAAFVPIVDRFPAFVSRACLRTS